VTTTTRAAIIGAGYVGLPLAVALAQGGRPVTCVDVSENAVQRISAGDSYISDVPSDVLAELVGSDALRATTDYSVVAECDDVVLCVPTPLSRNREPDLAYVLDATRSVGAYLRKGHLVVLESTTYPGTTRDELKPVLEQASGLVAGVDFHLAMSPERIDPGRVDHTIRTVPKVIGGLTPACTQRARELYEAAIDTLVEVSSPEAAELTKLLENIFRSVNIALVNELAMLCDRLGLDGWEVLDAAATKPFGFMPFKPGPGLGGHCLPLDPFYLAWKAREVDFQTEFIELAGKVNANMPYFCVQKIARALNREEKSLHGSRVLLLGVAYKPNIDDTRESPALKLIELLRADGADVAYHDPHVPELPRRGLRSVELSDEELDRADAVVVVTDHRDVDYPRVVERAAILVDFRNATRRVPGAEAKVVRL
jgi:UDP-N-acetyl-D-glucosamine dehydrogenase